MNSLFKISSKILVIVFCFICFCGCKRYEDGPEISFIPKKYRLVGKWNLKTINDRDLNPGTGNQKTMLSSCNTTVTYEESSSIAYLYEFKDIGAFIKTYTSTTHRIDQQQTFSTCTAVYQDSEQEQVLTGEFKFKQNGSSLEINSAGVKYEYVILRLTQKDLWIAGGSSKMKFEKK